MLKLYIVPSHTIELNGECTLLDVREAAVDFIEEEDYKKLLLNVISRLNEDSLDTVDCWFFLVAEDGQFETLITSPL